jgi:hypothetical protein
MALCDSGLRQSPAQRADRCLLLATGRARTLCGRSNQKCGGSAKTSLALIVATRLAFAVQTWAIQFDCGSI